MTAAITNNGAPLGIFAWVIAPMLIVAALAVIEHRAERGRGESPADRRCWRVPMTDHHDDEAAVLLRRMEER